VTSGARRLNTAAVAFVSIVSCLVVAGCGGSATTSTGSRTATTSSSSPTTTAAQHHTRPRRRPGEPVGHTQLVHAGTSMLEVTVTRIHDPLLGSGAALPPGTRAVGVALSIHNHSGETYDSTASGDVSIVSSSGLAAPLFIKAGVCETPLTDFESLIGVGETRAGCVGFAVPRSAKIMAVRFSPHSRRPGSVTWR
jgi:hypothetical protein